jgi:hypothetical protein
MLFRVTVTIGFLDGSARPFVFIMPAINEDDVREQVTREYVLTNLKHDWGKPIQDVIVVKAEAVERT